MPGVKLSDTALVVAIGFFPDILYMFSLSCQHYPISDRGSMDNANLRNRISSPAKIPLRTALIYAIVAGLWILLSDKIAGMLASDRESLVIISTYKGWFFVLTTAILLFLYIRRSLHNYTKTQEALRESEERFRLLVEGVEEYAIFLLDPKGNVVSWNNGSEKITGYKPEDIIGRHLSCFYSPEDVESGAPGAALISAAQQGFFRGEGYRVRQDGSHFIANVVIRPMYDSDGTLSGFSTICRDITERKLAQDKVFHLNRLYALLSHVNAIIVRNRDRGELFTEICNAVVEDGKFIMAWIGIIDQEKRSVTPIASAGRVEQYLDSIQISIDDDVYGHGPIGTTAQTGTCFICNDIENNPRMKPWKEEALKRDYHSVASFPIRLQGNLLGTLNIYSTEAYFFDDDEVKLLDEVAEDISFALHSLMEEEQRRNAETELRRLNNELEQRVQERTAELKIANIELESFNYSVSHDLRSPLTVINGFSQSLLEECGTSLPESCRCYVDRIILATTRMAKLIDDLLNLTRVNRKDLQRQPFSITSMAHSVVHDLHVKYPDRTVSCRIQDDLEAEGDIGLMRLVLGNIMGNAWKYTTPREVAEVEFGMTTSKGKTAFFVKDNGVGFDMAYSDKLFKPFERLHSLEDFEGSGIGLATVKRIIDRHGGEIWAEAEPDKGSAFFFTLS